MEMEYCGRTMKENDREEWRRQWLVSEDGWRASKKETSLQREREEESEAWTKENLPKRFVTQLVSNRSGCWIITKLQFLHPRLKTVRLKAKVNLINTPTRRRFHRSTERRRFRRAFFFTSPQHNRFWLHSSFSYVFSPRDGPLCWLSDYSNFLRVNIRMYGKLILWGSQS